MIDSVNFDSENIVSLYIDYLVLREIKIEEILMLFICGINEEKLLYLIVDENNFIF